MIKFECIGVAADAHSASAVREEFAGWLERSFDLDAIRSNDLVLAVNEALANAAEFAYVRAAGTGTMDLRARYERDSARLVVTIGDEGEWRVSEPGPASRFRGRGIPLMRALSDSFTLETSTGGTRVHMQWDEVPAA